MRQSRPHLRERPCQSSLSKKRLGGSRCFRNRRADRPTATDPGVDIAHVVTSRGSCHTLGLFAEATLDSCCTTRIATTSVSSRTARFRNGSRRWPFPSAFLDIDLGEHAECATPACQPVIGHVRPEMPPRTTTVGRTPARSSSPRRWRTYSRLAHPPGAWPQSSRATTRHRASGVHRTAGQWRAGTGQLLVTATSAELGDNTGTLDASVHASGPACTTARRPGRESHGYRRASNVVGTQETPAMRAAPCAHASTRGCRGRITVSRSCRPEPAPSRS